VPEEETVLVMVPVETVWTLVVVVMAGVALELLDVSSAVMPAPMPAATRTRTTRPIPVRLLLNHFLGPNRIYASLTVGRAKPGRALLPAQGR
jgi:hypothetical protein